MRVLLIDKRDALVAIPRPGLPVRDREVRVCPHTNATRDRYMGLNDLLLEIKQDPNSFLGDEATERKVLNQVLALVEDKISEVKNQAVKWYAHILRCETLSNTFRVKSGTAHQDHPRISDGVRCRQADRLLGGQGRGAKGHCRARYVLFDRVGVTIAIIVLQL